MKTRLLLVWGILAITVLSPATVKSQLDVPTNAIAEAITPQIQALAQGLQNDPTKIFNYVHDHIRYVHYFGSKKGAELTLLEKSGNDFDQSALLTALLHAAGYPNTAYQFGWEGAPFSDPSGNSVDLQHWFQLSLLNTNWPNTKQFLDNLFSIRGYPEEVNFTGYTNLYLFQRVWVNLTSAGSTYWLDPSFKVSQYVPGINLASASGFTSNSVISVANGTDAGNYVTNLNEVNIRGTLTGYTTNLLNYLQANSPNASVQQVLGGWQIVPSTNVTLSQISQNFPLATYAIDPTIYWTYEPTDLMASLQITFGGTNILYLMPQLQGQRISLTFSNNGVAQLWQEDTLIAQRSTSSVGTTNVVFTLNQPFGYWNDSSNVLVDNGYDDSIITNVCQCTNATYVFNYGFEPDWGWLRQRQNKLDGYLQQNYTNGTRQVVSETLNIMGLNWLLQTAGAEQMLAAQLGVLPQYHYRFGRMAQESGHGYYIDIQNLSGVFSSAGIDTLSQNRQAAHYDLNAYFASALEHGIIEQFQGSNVSAASTIKMLQIANTNGQAVFLASATNWTSSYNVNNHLVANTYDSGTLAVIANYISQGYYVLLPQNGSNHVSGTTGWAGYGYEARLRTFGIPMTNATGMFISGGYHGGYDPDPNGTASTPTVDQSGDSQPTSFTFGPGWMTFPTGGDPVDMVDGTFQVEHTDISIGQPEPHGITLSRYYNGTRRFSNPAGMACGWVHNYSGSANTVPAPQAGLGGTTPAQAASMIVATCAAAGVYDSVNPDPKNWMVSALVAKWGIDQLDKNGASIIMGKNILQFVKQPNGVFTSPANCSATLIQQTNSTYSLLLRHGNQYNFDSLGRLASINNQYTNNQPLTVSYLSTTSSLPYQVTDWKGRILTFNYTGGQLTSVSDNSTPARTIRYGYSNAYNSQGDLTVFTDAEGQPLTYAYDTSHEITAVTDAQSRLVVTNVYDGFGHVAVQYIQGDTNKTWNIFWSGYQSIEQNPSGNQRVFSYDNDGRQIGLADQLGNLTQTFYDGQNHITQTVSPLNETNRFLYNGNNNLIYSVDPLGFTNQFIYDGNNNLVTTIDPLGNPTSFGYNAQFSLTGQTNGAGDFVSFTYNTDGTVHTRSDFGGTTTYSYDSYGQVNNILYPNGLGSESFINSSLGDPSSRTDGNSNQISFLYNARRELTNTVAPNHLAVSVQYDSVDNVASRTDPRGNVTSNIWSATHRLLATFLPPTLQGTPVFTNSYDKQDWQISTLDPLRHLSFFTNDIGGRLISTTDSLKRTSTVVYNADGSILFTANAASETNSQTWNALGSLLRATDGAGHFSTRVYDPAGNQICLTNRNTNVWTFKFDAANRLTNTITPHGFSTAFTFNHQGLISKIIDQANQPTSLYYDAKGRLTNRVDYTSTFYGYDGNDNRTTVVEGSNTNAWSYDADNRVSSYRDISGNLIQYRYDLSGNVTNLIYPGNRTVTYFYDNLNRLTNVTDWSGRKTSLSYDLDSHLTTITRPNRSYQTEAYDVAGQATNILEQMSNNLPIALFRLNWTNSGNMAWEFAAPLPHSATVPTRTMTYNNDNQLLTVNTTGVNNDNDGNLTFGPLTNGVFTTFVYDARNRLSNVGDITNVYDAVNNRIVQTYGTNGTLYVVNPNSKLPQVLMRIKNNVTNYYIYGSGLLYQITEAATGTNTLTYHYDYRGSTIALSADNGLVTDRIEYSLYGLTTYRAGTNDTPFLFNGRYGVQTDPNGLLYMRARYYNPYLCRFVNPDPSRFRGGLNFYAYANGNPVTLLDPFGLDAADGQSLGSMLSDGWNYVEEDGLDIWNHSIFTAPTAWSSTPMAPPPQVTVYPDPSQGLFSTIFGGLQYVDANGNPVVQSSSYQRVDANGNSVDFIIGAVPGWLGGPAGNITSIIFDTEHALPHFVGTGIDQADVEAEIGAQLSGQLFGDVPTTVSGPFMGQINFGGQIIEYRGFGLPNGVINIGTYYIP